MPAGVGYEYKGGLTSNIGSKAWIKQVNAATARLRELRKKGSVRERIEREGIRSQLFHARMQRDIEWLRTKAKYKE